MLGHLMRLLSGLDHNSSVIVNFPSRIRQHCSFYIFSPLSPHLCFLGCAVNGHSRQQIW